MNRLSSASTWMFKVFTVVGLVCGISEMRADHLVASSRDGGFLALEPYGIMEFGGTYAWRPSGSAPAGVVTGTSWQSMDAGENHTLFVNSAGALFSWGAGESGQLGIPNPAGGAKYPLQVGLANDWKSVSAGGDLSSAIKTNGSLWAWGMDIFNGTMPTQSSVPVQIGTSLDWKSLATGSFHRLAIRNDGSLWAWGYNTHGSVGDGTNEFRSAPVRVGTANDWASVACGGHTSFAIKTDGSLWIWGILFGQGFTSPTSSSVPIPFDFNNDWRAIYPSTSQNSAFAIKLDGSLWSWGANSSGILGLGNTAARFYPERVGTALDWSSVAPGDQHVIATKNNGSIWIWGFVQNFNLPPSSIPVDRSSLFDPSPQISIRANSDPFISETSTFTLAPTVLNEPTANSLRISNNGLLPLAISAINLPPGFTLDPALLTVPPLGGVNYQVRLSATTKGQFLGTAHFLSNVASLPDFSLNLSGWVVSPLDDTDADGLNDAAELSLTALGFRWDSSQSALVETLISKSKFAGLISNRDIFQVELKVHAPVIDNAAQNAQLQFEFHNSVDGSSILLNRKNLQGPSNEGIKLDFQIPEGCGYVRLRGASK